MFFACLFELVFLVCHHQLWSLEFQGNVFPRIQTLGFLRVLMMTNLIVVLMCFLVIYYTGLEQVTTLQTEQGTSKRTELVQHIIAIEGTGSFVLWLLIKCSF